jgi:hypothetical protein
MTGLTAFCLRNRDIFAAAALVVVTLVAGGLFMVPLVTGVFHDDGIYVSTAKSLASDQGYRLISLPDTPSQTKYPPLYPTLLSIIWRIWPAFPANVLAMQWLTLLMSALSMGLFYYYVVTCGYFSRPVALLAALLSVTSHYMLYYSSLLLSEMPFAFFLILALFMLDRFVRSDSNRISHKVLLTMVIVLPFLTRSIGVVLIPAALAFLLFRRRLSWMVGIGTISIVAAWFAWSLHSKESSPVVYYYTSYWDWWRDFVGVRVEVRVILFNLVSLAYGIVYSGETSLSRFVSWQPRLWPLIALAGIPAFVGLWRGLRRKEILPWTIFAYLLVVLIWPWPPLRFIVPVLGFLLCYLVGEAWRLLRNLPPSTGRKALVAAASLLLILGNVWQTRAVASFNHKTHYPTTVSYWQSPANWSCFTDAFGWIESHTRPTDIIASYFDSMVFLYTGRRAFRPLVVAPASPYYGVATQPVTVDELLLTLKANKGRYVLCTPFDRFNDESSLTAMVDEVRRRHPRAVSTAYVGKDPRFKVYRIRIR